ncbi:nuclease-related domain-containing protein [Streptomyces sp. NPDC047070]|uniref:nuclease-related domain-containing protein n=1 Tax=Streptomyces sp. NPDC047070 TaxID=3154923 RepID=UPI003456796B
MPYVIAAAVLVAFRFGLAGVLFLAAVGGVGYMQRARIFRLLERLPVQPRPRKASTDAGASAFARARELRTPTVRIATALGIPTQAERTARNYEAGGKGEQAVAELLAPLEDDGWKFLYDRRLPRGRANIDILALSPRGHVYVLDPKNWTARFPLSVQAGRLMRGERDVTDWLDGLKHETATVDQHLGAGSIPVAVMVRDAVAAGEQLRIDGIRIVAAVDVCSALRRLDGRLVPRPRPSDFAAHAALTFPPYVRKRS